MSSKVKPYPLSSTREVSGGLLARSLWSKTSANLENVRFVRSLTVQESDFSCDASSDRSRRSIALGLALALCVSASFWTGIALMVARVWK